ncbi:MAG: hypothetical protein JSS57_07255 [Proteobacteria bacterium]|nr:hypothetical protein [Pseudomonadota bacterium]
MSIVEYHHRGLHARSSDGGATFAVTDDAGKHVAALARMPWGKIKIIGEDTYSYDATALLKRLHGRRLDAGRV